MVFLSFKGYMNNRFQQDIIMGKNNVIKYKVIFKIKKILN